MISLNKEMYVLFRVQENKLVLKCAIPLITL